jgi:hypothetical protein
MHGTGYGTKIGAWKTRGNQDRSPVCEADTDSQGGVASEGGTVGGVSGGNAGVDREGSSIGDPLTGGIIDQLIDLTRERLDNASACIDWYQREQETYQTKLDNLMKLQALYAQSVSKKKQKNDQNRNRS